MRKIFCFVHHYQESHSEQSLDGVLRKRKKGANFVRLQTISAINKFLPWSWMQSIPRETFVCEVESSKKKINSEQWTCFCLVYFDVVFIRIIVIFSDFSISFHFIYVQLAFFVLFLRWLYFETLIDMQFNVQTFCTERKGKAKWNKNGMFAVRVYLVHFIRWNNTQ